MKIPRGIMGISFFPSPTSTAALIVRCRSARRLREFESRLIVSGVLRRSLLLHDALIRAFSIADPPHALPLLRHIISSSLLPGPHTLPSFLRTAATCAVATATHAVAAKLALTDFSFVVNALVAAYARLGHFDSAYNLLDGMPQCSEASSYTPAFNALVTAYARAGNVAGARNLFDGMPCRDCVSWSAMINGYAQNGHSQRALELFEKMLVNGFAPDDMTLVGVLSACAHLGALEQGKWVHGYLKGKKGSTINVFLGTGLVDMYTKCGAVELGFGVFQEMKERNVLAWTTMIKGLAMHGRGAEAVALFRRMERSGIVPDDIAFISVLSACTHSGMVDEGREIFASMAGRYKLKPKLEHYGCMVDLLARHGLLDEARKLVDTMPMRPDSHTWGALLAGCRFHKRVELAEDVAVHLLELEPGRSGAYVLLGNIYAASGRHADARKVRRLMKSNGVEKTPGCSSVEIDGVAHQFIVGDTSHPRMREIAAKWEEVEEELREKEGYVPEKGEVLLDIEEEDKESALSRHSEKLAIAFAMLCTGDGTAIRVMKNLRVCLDCHHVTKLISKVYGREITVRDRSRFHLFRKGACSCNDYW